MGGDWEEVGGEEGRESDDIVMQTNSALRGHKRLLLSYLLLFLLFLLFLLLFLLPLRVVFLWT